MKNLFFFSFFLFISSSLSTAFSSTYQVRQKLQKTFSQHGVKSLIHVKDAFQKSPATFELGRNLFFDKILSGNKNISCATCHTPSMGTGDFLPVSIGEGGIGLGLNRQLYQGHLIPRNAPAVYNRALTGHTTVMWDGRIKREINGELQTPEPKLNGKTPYLSHIVAPLESTLAVQALFPVTSHEEMRGATGTNEITDAQSNEELWEKLTTRVLRVKKYRELIKKAYPLVRLEKINFGHLANAIGVYEGEAFRATNTAFDRFMDGHLYELSDSQVRGAKLFTSKGKCLQCHKGQFLTDFDFHNIGVPHIGPGKQEIGNDRGLELITNSVHDRYKFKTPPLRNIVLTAPYMHNGFFTDLRDAIIFHLNPKEYYDVSLGMNDQEHSPLFANLIDLDRMRNDERTLTLSPIIKTLPTFSDREIDDLISFLNSLTDFKSLGRPMGGIPKFVPSGLPVKD